MIKNYYVEIPPHLSDVLADLGGVSPDADFSAILAAGRTALFNFSYPIPNADKAAFETWFCNHYMMRRVGSGNIKKWRQMLTAKLWDIMPYYSQLMESEHITFDPLINNDITTTDEGAGTNDTVYSATQGQVGSYSKTGTDDVSTEKEYENSGTKNGNETTNSTEVNRYSDTPQGDSSRIWEIGAGGQPQLNNIYLTDIRGITDNASRQYSENTTGEGTENGSSDRDWTESGSDRRDITDRSTTDNDTTHSNENVKLGVAGQSKSKLLSEYRETFLRIYQMIAEELDELFYNLYEIDDLVDYV